jgi:diguanylate cyclase
MSMPSSSQTVALDSMTEAHLRRLPKRLYWFRILGMCLVSLPVIAVLHELRAPWPSWAWMFFSCFLWPHLARLLVWRSADPFRAELRNLMIDSAVIGTMAPLMHFNLLPSVLLCTLTASDKLQVAIRGLLLRSLPVMALAILAGSVVVGFQVHVQTRMTVILACLPILVIYTLATSRGTYRLLRRTQRQNLQLAALSQRDALTGLQSRGFWEQRAQALLQQHQADGSTALLMLLDVDEFKRINDEHGHGAGDDVLTAIAGLLRQHLPDSAHVGRFGGDEFVAAMSVPAAEATHIAEALRQAVAVLQFPQLSGFQPSVSIGIAVAPPGCADLREWMEIADRAMYRAKRTGRNRVVDARALQGDGA